MKTSEKNENILKAIAKIQSEMPAIKKSGKNTYFKTQAHPDGAPYVMLSDILEATKPLEKDNSISVLHFTRPYEDKIYGVTRLFHSSGEWAEIEIPLLINKQDMQGLKSAITYSKRANLEGFYNIEPEFDDDGNQASSNSNDSDKKIENTHNKLMKEKKATKKSSWVFFGGKYQGQKFDDIMPEVFSQYLNDLKAIETKTPKTIELINEMTEYLNQKGLN